MTYCKYCKREVEGVKPFSYWWAFFWMLVTFPSLGLVGLAGYILYWGIKSKRCPICNAALDTTYHYGGQA